MTKIADAAGEVTEENKQQLNTLIDDIKKYQRAKAMTTSNDPMSQITSANVPSSTSNPKFIVGVRQEELRNIEKIYETRYQKRRKLMDDIHDLLIFMAKLETSEIQYKEIVEILHKAIELLAAIKENWNDLVIFFTTISEEIEVATSSILTPFIEHASEIKLSYTFANDRAFLLDSIEKQGNDVQHEARLIFLVSRTYVDVSTKFLMKRLSGLSRSTLISDDNKRLQMLNDLKREENQVEKEVRELVSSRRRVFQGQVSKQRMQLQAMAEQLGDGDEDDHEAIIEGKKLLAKVI